MQHIDYNDRDLFHHAYEVVADLIFERDGYTDQDTASNEKLGAIGLGGTALVVTGSELSRDEAAALLDKVVMGELNHWIPGASRRLIWRAAAALGFETVPLVLRAPIGPDCGNERALHALSSAWLGRHSYMVCSTCGRVFD